MLLRLAFCRSCLGCRQLSRVTPPESSLLKKLVPQNVTPRCHLASRPRHPLMTEAARRKRAIAAYTLAAVAGMFGLAYLGVPLYRIYCQATGKGTKAELAKTSGDRIMAQTKAKDRLISVRFSADVSSGMTWTFKPLQRELKVFPGETALAFYTAKNPEPRPVIGVATYNVVPYEAAQYFTKVQCFCFDEQRLNPGEEVEMPVLFYIDGEFANDPLLQKVDTITLSYTFFESKDEEGDLHLSPLIAR